MMIGQTVLFRKDISERKSIQLTGKIMDKTFSGLSEKYMIMQHGTGEMHQVPTGNVIQVIDEKTINIDAIQNKNILPPKE